MIITIAQYTEHLLFAPAYSKGIICVVSLDWAKLDQSYYTKSSDEETETQKVEIIFPRYIIGDGAKIQNPESSAPEPYELSTIMIYLPVDLDS